MSDQVRLAYPRYKIFVYGVDISNDVVSVTANFHDGESPNTCNFTILNKDDRYIINTADMVALHSEQIIKNVSEFKTLNIPWMNKNQKIKQNKVASGYSTGILTDPELLKAAVEKGILDKTKRSILLRKLQSIPQQIDSSERTNVVGNPLEKDFTNYFGTSVRRYPLHDGSPIFHSMDPVRIFMRDPYDPTRWYHHFCGFISDMVDSSDENNTKVFTIAAEDPTKLFRYTRVFVNPGIIDARAVIQEQDIKVQSFHAHFMRGMNLPEIFFTLLFGPDKAGTEKFLQSSDGQKSDLNISTKLRGIGHFSFDASGIFLVGPDTNQDPKITQSSDDPSLTSTRKESKLLGIKPEISIGNELSIWQSLIDHEVQPSDLWTMAADDLRDSTTVENIIDAVNARRSIDGTLNIEEVVNEIGSRPELYRIDGGRLMMLIPKSLGAENRKILVEDIIQAYPLNSEWHSAGHIMYEVTERIQFKMYCSPKGDLIIEPPLYDFDPDDFGLDPISSDAFISSLQAVSPKESNYTSESNSGDAISIFRLGEILVRSNSRGPFGLGYIIYRSDTIDWEIAFVDEKVFTVVTVPRAIFQNWEGQPFTDIIGDLAVIKLPDLIPLYGVRQIPVTPRGYVVEKEAAELYGRIQLAKTNAEAHTMKVNHLPNLKLGINRPLYVEGRNSLATTKQITHSITWGESGMMNTTTDLYAARIWDGLITDDDPPQPIYTSIGGSASRSIDYSILFRNKGVPENKELIGDTNTGFTNSFTNPSIDKISPQASDAMIQLENKEGVE